MSALQQEDRDMISDIVEKFIDDNYAFEKKHTRLKNHQNTGSQWTAFAELGWLALTIPEELGGLGGDVIDAQVLMRAFGRGLIEEPYFQGALVAAKVIELCAAPHQAEVLLASIAAGEQCAILAHGERLAGPTFLCVKTTARKVAEGYIINGVKRVVYHAKSADYFLVTAVIDDVPALLRVKADAQNLGTGLETTEFPTIDSHVAMDIHFNDLQVNADALLATGDVVERGIKDALLFGIASVMGELEGIAVVVRKMTAEYLNTRVQFGTEIGKFQALQHKLSDIVIAEEEVRSLAWMVCDAMSIDDRVEREKMIRSAKVRAGKVSRQLAETSVQLYGGIGVTDELVIGHYLRRIIALDTMYGDAQQQLTWLAKQY